MSLVPIDEVVHIPDALTHDPDTGAATDADSAPTFDVFEEATDTPILDDQTMTKRTSLTGNYRGSFTASAANGFEAGKWYNVIVTATVGGITAKCRAMHFRVAPAETSAGVPQVRASAIADGTIVAATLGANAITAAKLDPDVTTELQAGLATASALATAQTSIDDLPTNAELTTALAAADDAVLAAIAALNNLSAAQVTAAVPTATQNADALLKRDLSAVTGEAARSALNALRFLRNKWSIAGAVLTVTKEDDTTTAWTGAVTQTAGDPVSEIDPA